MTAATDPYYMPDAKLPLWQAIQLAYTTYFHFFVDVMRIAWLWVVTCILSTGITSYVQRSYAVAFAESHSDALPGRIEWPTGIVVLLLVSSLLPLIGSISIAVAWHRRLILGERPRLSGSNVATVELWRYIGTTVAIWMVIWIPGLIMFFALVGLSTVATALGKAGAGLSVISFLANFAGVLVLVAMMLRLSLLLPAMAVGNRHLTVTQALRRTRGNTWRIGWGLMACTLVPMLIIHLAVLALTGFPDPRSGSGGGLLALSTTVNVAYVAYYLLVMPIAIGFLSIAYRHFFART
jgi:hypothetical protein